MIGDQRSRYSHRPANLHGMVKSEHTDLGLVGMELKYMGFGPASVLLESSMIPSEEEVIFEITRRHSGILKRYTKKTYSGVGARG